MECQPRCRSESIECRTSSVDRRLIEGIDRQSTADALEHMIFISMSKTALQFLLSKSHLLQMTRSIV